MIIEAIVALSIHLELLSELISFGALSAFVLLNIGVLKIELMHNNLLSKIKFLIPLIGVCILILILATINAKAISVVDFYYCNMWQVCWKVWWQVFWVCWKVFWDKICNIKYSTICNFNRIFFP